MMMLFFFLGFISACIFLYNCGRLLWDNIKGYEISLSRKRLIYGSYWGIFIMIGLSGGARNDSINMLHDLLIAIAIGSIIFTLLCILQVFYYSFRLWSLKKNNLSNYRENTNYKNTHEHRTKSAISLFIYAVIFLVIVFANDEPIQKESLSSRLERFSDEDKILYESKLNEYSKTMDKNYAKERAIIYTESVIEENKRIKDLDGNDKRFFDKKFNEYKNLMDEIDAKSKALRDLDREKENYNKELQKKYDDQKQYEEWMAWKQEEKEKEEKALLQKKYDDQKQYEEWITWKQQKDKSFWLIATAAYEPWLTGTYGKEPKYMDATQEEPIGEWISGDDIVSLTYLPSSKQRADVDWIFGTDPGYQVTVIERLNGKPSNLQIYHFKKGSNNWSWRINMRLDSHFMSPINEWSDEDKEYAKKSGIDINKIPANENLYVYTVNPAATYKGHGDWRDIDEAQAEQAFRQKAIEISLNNETVNKYIDASRNSNVGAWVFKATHSTTDDK